MSQPILHRAFCLADYQKKMDRAAETTEIIELADGYNGNKAKFYAEPIAVDGDLVKLRCAEPGKEYMTTWKFVSEVENAKQ